MKIQSVVKKCIFCGVQRLQQNYLELNLIDNKTFLLFQAVRDDLVVLRKVLNYLRIIWNIDVSS